MSLNIKGVDISFCQQGLNYEKLKKDGIEFAIIRASVTGTGSHKQSIDSLLNRHVNGCISENIDLRLLSLFVRRNRRGSTQRSTIYR